MGRHDPTQSDPRSAAAGTTSAYRAIYELLRQYGPWLATLENADRMAIVVSTRMARIETWDGKIGSSYFDALFEAYSACMYAHRPASYVFVEDLKPDTLKKYKAVLVVNQRVELDPPLAAALAQAQKDGVKVFHDGTCRPELVKNFTPLSVSFDRVKQDPSAWQDDAAYYRFPQYFKAHAEVLRKVLGPVVPPVAECDNPEVMLTERRSGDGSFVWAVNNTMLGWDPGLMWRMSLEMTHRVPVVEKIKLDVPEGWVVYDVFYQKKLEHKNGEILCDLRMSPAQLYAVLPEPVVSYRLEMLKTDNVEPIKWVIKPVRGKNEVTTNISRPIRVSLAVVSTGQRLGEQFMTVKDTVSGEFSYPTNRKGLILWMKDLITDKYDSVVTDEDHPAEIVTIERPGQINGPHVRDVAVSPDGKKAVFSLFNWGQNVSSFDLRPPIDNALWDSKVGHGFAFAPQASTQGFFVQGFDVHSAEGYHLYELGIDGKATKRFALYGMPKRATSWASAAQLQDVGINNFATAPDGTWVASAGDLGLVVWDRDGKELWADEWWKTTRKRVRLLAVDDKTILVMEGATAIARDARSGKVSWSLALANTGTLLGGVVSGDRKTVVLRADTLGGRLFVIRDGKLINTIMTSTDEVALSPVGSLIAVTDGSHLKTFDPLGGLLWTYTGDDTLRHPGISPDGKRIVVGSELGTLSLFEANGRLISYRGPLSLPVIGHRDVESLPVSAWLPDGGLLVATWLGDVIHYNDKLDVVSSSYLDATETDARSKLLAKDATPTVRKTGWGNATATPLPLTPNLLAETKALIMAVSDPRAHGDPRPWQNKIELLTDGKPDAPPKPWLEWTDIGMIDSGWRGKFALEIDTFRTQLRVTGITFVEDPAHPESWLRDMRLQWWDAAAECWRDGPYLLSDAAVHSHVFDKPIEAARFRFISTGGGTWPVGNIRLGELVFHGEVLGCSHPDAIAKNPVAVLFDEKEGDLKALNYPGRPFVFHYGGAFSGGKCLELSAAGETGPAWQPPFGHAIPNWDFEIAENPKPGQYRYLQFAWKATSDKTTGMGLLLGRAWPGGVVAVIAGDVKWKEGVIVEHKLAGKPSTEWQTVRVDLWAITKGKPPRIQALSLMSAGGGALYDQIVLGRTERDLDKLSVGSRP